MLISLIVPEKNVPEVKLNKGDKEPFDSPEVVK